MSVWKEVMVYLLMVVILMINAANAQRNKTEDCRDKLIPDYCKLLKDNGACYSKLFEMMNFCPETCKFCEIHCNDFLPRLCPWWQHHFACITHPKIMNKYCRKSCGKCSSAAPPKPPACSFSEFGCCWDKVTARGPDGKCPECRDKYAFCREFRVDCYTGPNRGYMHLNCPKTCRVCYRQQIWQT